MQIGAINSANLQAAKVKAKATDSNEIKDSISLGNSEKSAELPVDLKKLTDLKSGVADSELFKKVDILTGLLVGGSAAGIGYFGGAPVIGVALSSIGGAVFGGLLLKDVPQTTIAGLAGAYIGAGIGALTSPTGVLIGGGIGAVAGGLLGSIIMNSKMDEEHKYHTEQW